MNYSSGEYKHNWTWPSTLFKYDRRSQRFVVVVVSNGEDIACVSTQDVHRLFDSQIAPLAVWKRPDVEDIVLATRCLYNQLVVLSSE